MKKPKMLKKGDKIALVSLSSGILGDDKARLNRTIDNIKKHLNVEIVFMPNSLLGSKKLYESPQLRAKDLMDAFLDPSIKAIISLTGGDDTIRLLPYIDFNIIKENPKIFMGYSDTTVNHFMMYKAGLMSYYGPAAGVEFSLPNVNLENINTVKKTLFEVNNRIELKHYNKAYNDPEDWDYPILTEVEEDKKYDLIQGSGVIKGKLLGGCIDVFPLFIGTKLWPEVNEWENKILFIETSESIPNSDDIKYILYNMGVQGVLNKINGILIGRPKNGINYNEYNNVIKEVTRIFDRSDLPILANCHFGHAWLWNIMPIGAEIEINCDNKTLTILEPVVE